MSHLCYWLFVLLAIPGFMAERFFENCNPKKCQNLELMQELQGMSSNSSTEEKVNRFCQPIGESLDCGIGNLEDCAGQKIYELSPSDNRTFAPIGNAIIMVSFIAFSICTEGSEISDDNQTSIFCMTNLAVDAELQRKCFQEGYDAYARYKESKGLAGEQLTEEEKESKSYCMVSAYTLACFTSEIHDSCGEVARDIYMEKLKDSLKFIECTEDDFQTLKAEFLDFLELEEQKRGIFHLVFDSPKWR